VGDFAQLWQFNLHDGFSFFSFQYFGTNLASHETHNVSSTYTAAGTKQHSPEFFTNFSYAHSSSNSITVNTLSLSTKINCQHKNIFLKRVKLNFKT
jgi:hypothetical protein